MKTKITLKHGQLRLMIRGEFTGEALQEIADFAQSLEQPFKFNGSNSAEPSIDDSPTDAELEESLRKLATAAKPTAPEPIYDSKGFLMQ